MIIRQDDCGYDGHGLSIGRNDNRRIEFKDRIFGRVLAQDVVLDKEIIGKKESDNRSRIV